MFHRVACPTCKHKFTVREASMGQRQTCPNCQSHFLAGKSVAEDEAAIPMTLQTPAAPAVDAGINKTMLGESEPPIRYNCPRCKKPLEAPSSEAGVKKPCPACGQRLQIPAAPKLAPQTQPSFNKTMLAADEGAAPSSAFQAGQPMPTANMLPSAAPKGPLSRYAMAGITGAGVLLVGLLACVIAMFFSGGADREKFLKAQQDFANAQKELADLKKSIQQNEELMTKQKEYEAAQQKEWDRRMEEQRTRQRELDAQRELDRRNSALQNDKELAAKTSEKRRQEEDDIRRQERDRQIERAKFELEMKTKLETLKLQLEAESRKAQQATVIISQPPPPYYPPYHPRYYWGW